MRSSTTESHDPIGANRVSRAVLPAVVLMAGFLAAGCSPTVKVEAPDKPIVINLNVKIEQEVRVKVDKDVDNLIKSDPNVF
ncbi:MAG TPA: YnbE family lipoprotein [Dongiaceae bacterium]|nr:YnbE family lipoprotein [Dongiaceae bacterium]